MGCATSRLGTTVTHVPEAAALPLRIRRRLDSIRRRRRVADSFITAGKESTSLSKKLLLEAAESDKEMNMSEEEEESPVGAAAPSTTLEREKAECIIEAVKRAIDDVILDEEEAAGDLDDDDDDNDAGRRVVARGKDDGEVECIGSPSFRVYCAGPKPFGSFASIDYEVKSVEDVPKAKHHESTESIESLPTLIPEKEGSTGSSSKSKGGRKYGGGGGGEETNKVASCRKKGPLGMKMLLNLTCYSCAAHPDRTRIAHK